MRFLDRFVVALGVFLTGTLACAQSHPPAASCLWKYVGQWQVTGGGVSYPVTIRADGTATAHCAMCVPSQRWTCEGENKFWTLDPYHIPGTLSEDMTQVRQGRFLLTRVGAAPRPPQASAPAAAQSTSTGSPESAACASYFQGATFDTIRRTCLAPKVSEAVCRRLGGQWHKDRGHGADVCEYDLPQTAAAASRPSGAGGGSASGCPQGFTWVGGYQCAAYNVDAAFCAAHRGRLIAPPGNAPTRCMVDAAPASENTYDVAGRPIQNNVYDTTGGPTPPPRYGSAQVPSAGPRMSPADRRNALRAAIAKRNPLLRRPMPVDEQTARSLGQREQEALYLLARLETVSFLDELEVLLQLLKAVIDRFPDGLQKAALNTALQYYREQFEAEKRLAAQEEAERAGGEAEPPLLEFSPEIKEWFANRPAPGRYLEMSRQDCRYWKGVYGTLTGCLIERYDRVGAGDLRMLMIVDEAASVTDPTRRTVRAIVEEGRRELN